MSLFNTNNEAFNIKVMSKTKISKTKLGCISILLVIFVSISAFYIYIGIKFGEATVEAATELKKIQEDWKAKGINPIDSVKQDIMEIIDSTKTE